MAGESERRLMNVDELEFEVARRTVAAFGGWLGALEDCLKAYLAAFRVVGEFTSTKDNRHQELWLRLVSRSFNSLRWGRTLIRNGYYAQAFILARSALEDWLAYMDSIEHEDTVEALLQGGQVAPFRQMAKRSLPEDLRAWWGGGADDKVTYGFLSTFSRPRYRAVMMQLDPETLTLRVGPLYDEVLFLTSWTYVTEAAVRMSEFAARIVLVARHADTLNVVLGPAVDKAIACLAEVNSYAQPLPGGDPPE